MERLERKKVSGRYYYYFSKWEWKNGRCRRIWQKYLGKLEDIAMAMEQGGTPPNHAEVFEYGLSTTLWKEATGAAVASLVDSVCPKRNQGLSVGEYVAVAAINRAMNPVSKNSMWEWFTGTSLLRHLPAASADALASQRFWDHMDKISAMKAQQIWKTIIKGVLEREQVDVSSISYDGTNFYTFIDTFNMKCTVARRGKNKQGRCNLRQVGYALFCTADGHIPLMYDVYEGNRNDTKQFPEMLDRFAQFMKEIGGQDDVSSKTTVVFDKGNNSQDNFALVDSHKLKFIGAVKLDQVKELAGISNKDSRFSLCESPNLEGTTAFRVSRELYGKKRTLVVTYNQNLFNAQWLTVHNDIASAMKKLDELSERLAQRAAGLIKGGKAPTVESVTRQCATILKRQHIEKLIHAQVTEGNGGARLACEIDADAVARLADTYLGKNILITNRNEWSDDKIILGYRSQYIIEDVFKEMKDRQTGSWWPLFHWTDSKIQVHGLYCTIALLLRALAYRRIRRAGIAVSMKRMLTALSDVKQVVNVFKLKRGGKEAKRQTVFTKTSELQDQLFKILDLEPQKNDF
ncbi:MAG: IS1634 family transposase [Planctomycetota bacterium]